MIIETDAAGREGGALNALFACLANSDRRRLLGFLHERAPDSLTRRDLATRLVSSRDGTRDDRASDEAVQRALVGLHHAHLPELEAAGLIDQDPDREAVTVAAHSAFRDAGIVEVLENGEDADAESLDALFGALAAPRRRTVLDVLSHQFHPIHTETLAREIGAEEHGTTESNVAAGAVEEILVDLRHVQLPLLSEASLIEYDADEGMVAYGGHPELRVPWMHSVLDPDFRASLTGVSEDQEIGTIEGRERVVSFGQSLCDRADEELFCMFTDTEMLEAGCFTRIRDASRRGADVYLGTCDPTVREYVLENAPEVVLWEPKTDWLNLPIEGNRVGRLLLADREAVMLGTLGERDEDGVHEEKAIVGEGSDNTLVVMIRQMLSPHLDQFQQRAEDIEANLPF